MNVSATPAEVLRSVQQQGTCPRCGGGQGLVSVDIIVMGRSCGYETRFWRSDGTEGGEGEGHVLAFEVSEDGDAMVIPEGMGLGVQIYVDHSGFARGMTASEAFAWHMVSHCGRGNGTGGDVEHAEPWELRARRIAALRDENDDFDEEDEA